MKTPQGTNSVEIQAPVETVWAILVDPAKLHEWAPMVLETHGDKEALDALRYCKVELNSVIGTVIKHCIDYEAPERVSWVIEDDSFGISELLQDIGFDFRLEVLEPARTLLVCSTFYAPRNLAYSMINPLLFVWRFRKIRLEMLDNIKQLAEGNPEVEPIFSGRRTQTV